MSKIQIRGIFLAFVGVAMFSLSLPMTHWALETYSPLFTATARAVIAAILAITFLLIAKERLTPPSHRKEFFYTMAGAVFGWPILIALALQRTQTAPTAVIASIMPLVTAVIAVLRGHEKVSKQFWVASILGTAILIIFTSSKGPVNSKDLIADLLVIGAVFASSFCYVQGAELTYIYPGWKVISWVVIAALPITIPSSIILWFTNERSHHLTTHAWVGMLVIGCSSMYLGFIPWYQGLKDAGTARGSQIQQLQVFGTLGWSVLLFKETIPSTTLICTIGIVVAVTWALFARRKQS